MYESFFGLAQRPFPAVPAADRYFPAPSMEAARATLARSIDRAEGPGLIVGPAGSGKTLLLEVLAEQFRDRFQVALLLSGQLTTRRALLQVILFELGLPYRHMEEGELRLSLIDHLTRAEQCPAGMLLLLDEAHTVPLRILEEVRMITNLVRHGQPRARLVLAGAPSIEEQLANPRLDALSQRLAARCYLDSLGRGETAGYLKHQVTVAGGIADRVFAEDAYEAVYRATGGVPRLMNQVCDHALMLAFTDGRRPLDAAAIEWAWADLQQLPAPWGVAPADAQSVVEFGRLEEETPALEANAAAPSSPPEIDAPVESMRAEATDPWPDFASSTEERAEPAGPTGEPLPAAFESEFYGTNALPVADREEEFLSTGMHAQEVEMLLDDRSSGPWNIDDEQTDDVGPRVEAGHIESPSMSSWDDSEPGRDATSAGYYDTGAPPPTFEEPATFDEPTRGDERHAASEPDVAEEEVVVDLYATLDARKERSAAGGTEAGSAPDWLEGLPRVTNRSADEMLTLAEALLQHEMAGEPAPLPASAPADTAALPPDLAAEPMSCEAAALPLDNTEGDRAAVDEGTMQEGAPDSPLAGEPFSVQSSDIPPDDSMWEAAPNEANEVTESIRLSGVEMGQEADMMPVATIEQTAPAEELVTDDRDMIVVEGQPDEQPAATVRRQEYRQLFARLRRGGNT
jgi:type II secretory pathway predicted ATPase ExeA